MSRLDELIKKLCPNGVEYKKLGDIGTIERGKRFVHADAVDNGIPCIHYGELYTYYGIWTKKTKSFVRTEIAKKLRYASKNDVIIVGAGENNIDIGIAVAYLGEEKVAVHDACYILHHKQDPKYISYFLRTSDYHQQIKKYVSRGKICSISADNISKAKLPVPPLEVQREIVHILDHFTLLTAELTAELTARQKQYEYYRDKLLTFDVHGGATNRIIKKTLAEIAEISTGSSNTDDAVEGGRYPFFVRSQEPIRKDKYEYDEEAIITAGDGVGVGKVFHYINGKYALHQRAYRIHLITSEISTRYLYHYFVAKFPQYIEKQMYHGSVPSIRRPMLNKFAIVIPSLETQQKIVSVLDNFAAICTDLNSGLPAEIKKRQQQYEYYRDKLLSF